MLRSQVPSASRRLSLAAAFSAALLASALVPLQSSAKDAGVPKGTEANIAKVEKVLQLAYAHSAGTTNSDFFPKSLAMIEKHHPGDIKTPAGKNGYTIEVRPFKEISSEKDEFTGKNRLFKDKATVYTVVAAERSTKLDYWKSIKTLDKSKVNFGVRQGNEGAVVVIMATDGYYLYALDKDGKKIGEKEVVVR